LRRRFVRIEVETPQIDPEVTHWQQSARHSQYVTYVTPRVNREPLAYVCLRVEAARGSNPPAGAAVCLSSRFGSLVQERRRAAGLTQQQLARAAAVSVGALRDLEQDRVARPRRSSLARLGEVLDLGPDLLADRAGVAVTASNDALQLRVLGPLVASRENTPVELGAARQRALLGLLALQPNTVLHRDRIVEALWDRVPPPSAVKMVQAYVGCLRRRLDPGRAPRDRDGLLVSVGIGYRLRADAGQLDLIAFERLASQAQTARRSGDLALACEAYSEALGLWRGEPLADVDVLSGHPAVIGLARRHAAVVCEFAEAMIGAGLHDRALQHLQALAERDPLDERAHAWLMIALAGTGQQAAALAVYHQLLRRLDEQLGVLPGAVLVQAHARVLRQDVPEVRPGPFLSVGGVPPRQLPRDPGVYVGRELEHGELAALAEQAAGAAVICVIDGTAGVGKTALAIHAGRQLTPLFPDGQLHADLRGFGPSQPPMPAAEALTGFLHALGVDSPAVPTDVGEQAAMYRSLLASRRMLIVLDNAADAAQVRPLLPGAPGCLVLVTSRSRLSGLTAHDGATRITLRPLAAAEAVSLLGNVLGNERVRAEQQAAADIAARCGLLPLALRVAAERAASRPRMALADLARQLADARARLDVLDIGEEDATALRAVFSWSYTALAAETARMFRLLGLHTGPDISLHAAAALAAADEAQAERLLELLAAAHLIEEIGPARYRLHDLLHVYAAEQACADESAESREAALRRMLVWYLHTADNADELLVPGRRHAPAGPAPPGCEPLAWRGYEQALNWCDAEQANLAAAVRLAAETGHNDVAWKLPVALRGFLDLRRPWPVWLGCATTGVAAARRAGDRSGQAWALDCLGHASAGLGRLEDALDCYREAQHIRREIGDQWGERANSMTNLGCTYLDLCRLDLALDCFQQVLAASRTAGNRYVECLALINLGQTYSRLKLLDDALACSLRALAAAREIGYRQAEGIVASQVAATYRAMSQPDKAQRCFQQALAIRRQARDRHGEAETLRDLGDLFSSTGHISGALPFWRQGLAIAQDLGDQHAAAALHTRLERADGAP
jgi:DNA-binding SARP family transcriptional activator